MLKLLRRSFGEIFAIAPFSLPARLLHAVFEAIKPIINIVFTARIIGELNGERSVETLFAYALAAVVLNLAASLLTSAFSSLAFSISYPHLIFAEKRRIADKLFSVDYERLENPEFDGKARKYKESVNMIGSHLGYFSYAFYKFFSSLFSLIAAAVIITPLLRISFAKTGEGFINSPLFAAVIFLAIAVMVLVIFFVNKKTQKLYFKLKNDYFEMSKIFSYYLDIVSDYKHGKEIRIFGEQELIERGATEGILSKGVVIRNKIANAMGLNTSIVAVISAVAGFGIYTLIGMKGYAGVITVDNLVMYAGSFMLMINAIIGVFTSAGNFSEILQTVGYYFDITDTENQRCGGRKISQTDLDKLEIEFKNVSFKYSGSQAYALKNLNIKINAGEKIAVVGHNGSGKSTFIKLLTKMYDGYEGEILINGVNMREFDTVDYRKAFAVVFQDYKIFSFTVAENVACAETADADSETIMRCLDGAGIGGRVRRMPKGTDTFLYKDYDKDGVEISGGESQKLALARALYKNAACVVLDEPTASLDPVAEYELYSKFNGLVGGKSAIYISHRLSSCRFCEKIAVFDKGELIQYGAHGELIKDDGNKYYELWNAQAKYYM
ncbi:MAG: ABC transporter ATP-binding protein/permease [Clostridiales bacterium]|jgi:ATP-binding cassette subfamily B protein|nr:ABC transporter ATP-binding protein/permease [Clostridiales bacterium]